MKKVSEIYICDICKKEEEKIQTINYPILFTTEQTEGTCVKPYISLEKLDACQECLSKIIRLTGHGAQGCNTYEIV